jgi:hypothetical protein
MQQHKRLSLPAFDIMQPDAVDFNELPDRRMDPLRLPRFAANNESSGNQSPKCQQRYTAAPGWMRNTGGIIMFCVDHTQCSLMDGESV